jgi:hypothetical protein
MGTAVAMTSPVRISVSRFGSLKDARRGSIMTQPQYTRHLIYSQ